MKGTRSYQQTFYSLLIFVIAFTIINFYIKVAKDEKRMRIDNQNSHKIDHLEGTETTCEKSIYSEDEYPSCRPEDPFILKPFELKCNRHLSK